MLSTRVWLSEAFALICAVLWTASIHDIRAISEAFSLIIQRMETLCEDVTVGEAQM